MNRGKLIGLIAMGRDGGFCDANKALVVRGVENREAFKRELASRNLAHLSITKVYEDDVIDVLLNYGGGYAFDPDAYRRFAPLGEKRGIAPQPDFDFTPSAPGLTKYLVLLPG